MNLDVDLLPWLITILIVFIFIQFTYIMFLIEKVANLREALFRDNNELEDARAEYEDVKGFTKNNDHKVIER